MKLIISLLIALSSSLSWGCYYDFTSFFTNCPTSWTGGIGKAVFLKCPNVTVAGVPVEGVSCIPNNGSYPYDTPESICLSATVMHLSGFLVCPGGPAPAKTRNNVPPELTSSTCGSIITTDTQVLSERIKLVGGSFSLVYSSDKVSGRKYWYKATVPITSPAFFGHSSIESEDLSISVAGQSFFQSFFPSSNLKYNFTWDGKDGGGTPAPGSYEVSIEVIENYNFSALAVPDLDIYDIVDMSSAKYIRASESPANITKIFLGTVFDGTTGFGGWDLDIHHYYDKDREILYKGDGSVLHSKKLTTGSEHWIVSDETNEIFVFDSGYNHVATRNALNNQTELTFSYNSLGKLDSVADKYGNITSIQYSGITPLSITAPNGQVTLLTTDANGYINSVENPAGETHEITYTSDGLLLTFKKPSGVISTMTYDTDGLLVSDTSSSGPSVTLNKMESGTNQIIEELSTLGRIKRSTISWSGNDYVREDKEASGKSITTTQNSLDKKVNANTSYSYQYSVQKEPNSRFSFMSSILSSFYTVDGGGMLNGSYSETAILSDPTDPFSFINLTASTTINSKLTQVIYNSVSKEFTETSPLGKTKVTVLNSLGDLQSVQQGLLIPVTMTYNSQGKVSKISQGASRETKLSYNLFGQLKEVENNLGEKTSYTYDLAGRVITTTLNDLRTIQFGYDLNGNLTSVTPPGRGAHLLGYNGFNALTSYTPAALIPTATTLSYSDDRELLSISKASGDVVSFVYDPITGNMTTINFPTGSRSFSYSNGILNGSASEDYIYRYPTQNGTKITGDYLQLSGGLTYSLYSTYNSDHLKSQESLLMGITNWSVPYSYDNDGFLIGAADLGIVRESSLGLVGSVSLDDISEEYTYSTNYGELSAVESKHLTTMLYKEEITRDNLGRINSMTETYGLNPSTVKSFTYDSTGRLISVQKNSLPHANYTYDSNSNRTSGTVNSVTTTASYDGEDQLLTFGTKSFTYNLNGEVATMADGSSTTAYTYDVFGNFKSVVLPTKTINYKVDAHNRRMVKLDGVNVVEYYILNSDNQIIGIADNSGIFQKGFVYGTKSHVPDYMIMGGDKFKIVTNHLGSPVVVVNSSTGAIAQEIHYDEWGNILSDTNPGFTPFGFAGCLYDQDTKLCRFGARDYDASIGRWLSKDPILFAGGDTNLYGYVLQDPINLIDPDGLYAVCTRALDIPGGEALYSSNSSASHTYIKYRDGSTSSFGPKGKINELGGGESCSADSGSDEQEKKMKDWANNNYNKNYNLMRYNCKDFTQDVINAGRR